MRKAAALVESAERAGFQIRAAQANLNPPKKPYTRHGRLEDVIALIQFLAMEQRQASSGDNTLCKCLCQPQSAPRSEAEPDAESESWAAIAREHPEFFRVTRGGATRGPQIHLIARWLSNEAGEAKALLPEQVNKLLDIALKLHSEQMDREKVDAKQQKLAAYQRKVTWALWGTLGTSTIAAIASIANMILQHYMQR